MPISQTIYKDEPIENEIINRENWGYDPEYDKYRRHKHIITLLRKIGFTIFNIFVVILFIAVVQLFIILKFL